MTVALFAARNDTAKRERSPFGCLGAPMTFVCQLAPVLLLAAAPIGGQSFVKVVDDAGGDPVLAVTYPWSIHGDSSVEVSMLPDNPALVPQVRPQSFRARVMRGEFIEALFRCESAAATVATTGTFHARDTDYTIFGRRNSLGVPVACVAWRTKLESATSRAEARLEQIRANAAESGKAAVDSTGVAAEGPAAASPGGAAPSGAAKGFPTESPARAAFVALESWSLDKNRLYLDLPKDFFAKPGKLRVWFMAGDRAMWSETVDWPGYRP
jgi:hypothetical protein